MARSRHLTPSEQELRRFGEEMVVDPHDEHLYMHVRPLLEAIKLIFSQFSITFTKAILHPAYRAKRPKFTCTPKDGQTRARRLELRRSIVLLGNWSKPNHPEADLGNLHSRLDGLPMCTRTFEFRAEVHCYWHYADTGWENGALYLTFSEDGWYESISRHYFIRNFVKKNEYEFVLYPTPVKS